jgi:sugar/nucleoside kinase (ribokinase family)
MGIEAGGAYNAVRALHRLGSRVGWATTMGNDLFSQFVLQQVRDEGVDTRLLCLQDRPVRSFSLAFSFTHERGFISYVDPVDPLDRSKIIRENPPRCVLLTGLEYGEALLETVAAAHQAGAIAAMDCQHAAATLETPGLVEALQAVDLFLPNAGEAMHLTGAASPGEAVQALSRVTARVVVKQGGEGALACSEAGLVCAPAIPAEVVDTTGAGDCFNAGFLHRYLQGDDLVTCLRYGNICGGLSTTAHGASAAPTAAEADALYRQLYGGKEAR